MPELVIHHMLGSRSDRIVWLAEELNLPYKLVLHVPNLKSGAVTSTLTDHVPNGKAPSVFLDGELLKESGYIVERLVRTNPHPDLEAEPSLDSIYWAHFCEGRIMSYTGPNMLNNVALPFVTKDMGPEEKKGAMTFSKYIGTKLRSEAQKSLDEADEYIKTHEWFSGGDKPGIGDIMMSFPLTWMAFGKAAPGGHKIAPATMAWLERVRARPAYQRMQKRIADERKIQFPRKAKM